MEFEIRHSAGIRFIDRFGDARQFALQPLEVGDAGALAGQPDGLAFDRDARLHDVVHHARLLGEREGEEVIENGDDLGRVTTVPMRSRISTMPSMVSARNASRTIGRLTPSWLASSRSRSGRSPASEPASTRSRGNAKTLSKPFAISLGCSPDFHPRCLDLTLVRPI